MSFLERELVENLGIEKERSFPELLEYHQTPHAPSLLLSISTFLLIFQLTILSLTLNPGHLSLPSNPRLRTQPRHPSRLGKQLHQQDQTQRLLAPPRARRNAHGCKLVRWFQLRPPKARSMVTNSLIFLLCTSPLPQLHH
jgi:hypothetical protein